MTRQTLCMVSGCRWLHRPKMSWAPRQKGVATCASKGAVIEVPIILIEHLCMPCSVSIFQYRFHKWNIRVYTFCAFSRAEGFCLCFAQSCLLTQEPRKEWTKLKLQASYCNLAIPCKFCENFGSKLWSSKWLLPFFFAVSLRLIFPVFLFSGGGIAKDFIPERYKHW